MNFRCILPGDVGQRSCAQESLIAPAEWSTSLMGETLDSRFLKSGISRILDTESGGTVETLLLGPKLKLRDPLPWPPQFENQPRGGGLLTYE